MKAEFNGAETNFDKLGLLVLDESEALETDGGEHMEYINGEYIWVA